MSEEINAQLRNNTWDLVPPTTAQNIISCKWIFTIKFRPNVSIERYKARLVAGGFNQQYGLDYSETFSPVIKSTTIRLVLEVAVKKNWSIHQVDINNAFLQGTLKEEVYVSQTPGFIDKDRPNFVCRLRKVLYGLKQAPRAWYQELKTFLLQAGFQNSLADTSLFIYQRGCDLIYVLVYVDDIIIAGTTSLVKAFNVSLANRFSVKDLGALSYFLGIEATRSSKGLHLMQRKYITDLLKRTNMLDAKPVSTPMSASPKLTLSSGHTLDDGKEYRAVIGSLQYLAFTRPDIAFAVNKLSQFMHKPTDAHWNAAKRILRYLAGTKSHGIFLRSDNPLTLHAFSDADWAATKMIIYQPMHTLFILAAARSHGHQRSNEVSHVPRQKLNIVQLQIQHRNFDGFVRYYQKWVSAYQLHRLSTVTTWVPLTYVVIRFSIRE
ncbi:putative RNA-directed DNA polymerase [Arabidopsis thaliana]